MAWAITDLTYKSSIMLFFVCVASTRYCKISTQIIVSEFSFLQQQQLWRHSNCYKVQGRNSNKLIILKPRTIANRMGNNLKLTPTSSVLCKRLTLIVNPHRRHIIVTSISLVHREIRSNISSPRLQPTDDILRWGKSLLVEKLDGSLRVIASSTQDNQGWCLSCFLQWGFKCRQLLFQHGERDVQRWRNRSYLEVMCGSYVQ